MCAITITQGTSVVRGTAASGRVARGCVGWLGAASGLELRAPTGLAHKMWPPEPPSVRK